MHTDLTTPVSFVRSGFCDLFAFSFFFELADVAFDPFFGFQIVGEFLFVSFEGRGVVVAAAVDVFGWVMDVEHFVEDDVLDYVFRHGEGIE